MNPAKPSLTRSLRRPDGNVRWLTRGIGWLVLATLLSACSPRHLLVQGVADELASQGQADEEDLAAARQAEAVACARAESAMERAVELAARLSRPEEQTERVRADLAASQERERSLMLAAHRSSSDVAASLKKAE